MYFSSMLRLSEEFPDLWDRVDLITGVSVGGLAALAMAFGNIDCPIVLTNRCISPRYARYGRFMWSSSFHR